MMSGRAIAFIRHTCLTLLCVGYLPLVMSANQLDSLTLNEASTTHQLNEQAYQHIKQGHYDLAFKFSEQARRLAVYQNDNINLSRALTNIGSSYFYLSQHEKALQQYQSAYDIARLNHDKEGISRALNNIGAVYVALENFTDAANIFKQCYDHEDKDELAKVQTLINWVHASSLGRIYPEFVELTEQLNRDIQTIEDPFTLAYFHQNMGDVFLFNEQPEKATTHFNIALDISKKHEFSTLKISNLLDLAEVALRQGETIEALNRIDDILSSENHSNLNKEHFAKAYHLLFRVYKAESQFEQALASLESYNRYAHELRELKVRQLAAIAKVERQTQQQIESLSFAEGKNLQLQSELNIYQSYFHISALLALALLSITIFLAYKLFRR
ncbi:MAG: tetratricopeptide repeat protein [Gammaproteobacteria bacterium]|nr:tetratricopeptide repeat protein [Gammaproteobacteria bacterium]NVK88786.1 tetratricopeptide repeat protein [Gammaproteobacteria bacterium]